LSWKKSEPRRRFLRLTLGVGREPSLSEGRLNFVVEAGTAHPCSGIPVHSCTAFTVCTDGLEAGITVGDAIRGAGSSIKGSLKRKAENAMGVSVNDGAPKIGFGATSGVLCWKI
jgi:hypothetical protein